MSITVELCILKSESKYESDQGKDKNSVYLQCLNLWKVQNTETQS